MYPSQYSQSMDFGGQRPASSARRNEYAQPPQDYGFSSSTLFTPGDPGGFVLPSSAPHHHQDAHCGPSPLGFINPSEHIGHNHGYPPMQQQQWPPPSGPGGFVLPGAHYPPPPAFPPVPQQQQQMSYPQQQMHHQYATHAHGAEHHGYPQHQRKTVHFLPPYTEQDPYSPSSEVSHASTAVGYANRNNRRDSVLSQSRPESVASRHSGTSSHHTLVPNSPTSAHAYATPNQIGMSVYNKQSGNLHSSSSPPRRHNMQDSRQAAYTWENLRFNV